MMLHRSTMKMLSDLISPKALERILSDAARERHTTLSALDAATLKDILKRDIYKRLQLTVPAALAKRRVQEVLDSLDTPDTAAPAVGHGTQIVSIEERAKQFALYFDWPETQRLRALLGVARQASAEGRDTGALLTEGNELLESLDRKLSEGLVTQGQDLSELKASAARLSAVGGPKIKRLDALIKQISEAQDSRTLLPAEVERAVALTLTLRKQIESSVVQQMSADQKREMEGTLAPGEEVQPFDLSLLPPEAQVRVQALEREHEARQLAELSRDHIQLLRLDAALDHELQALKDRSAGLEVLGEASIQALRVRLGEAREDAATRQREQLSALSARLDTLEQALDRGEHDDGVEVARQGLSLALGTLQAGGLVNDEVTQLSELVGTLEHGDAQLRERLMALQRESFELERRAREVPGALGDLSGPLEQARAALAAGQLTNLEPLWDLLERRMGEAALQRESMDTRAGRVLQDYDRYRHLAGETIQKLGRLADVLRSQQRLGVLSNDARDRYLMTLESAEALLTEAQAEFQAARELTATFGADALSDLLGVFDAEEFDGGAQDVSAGLLSTSNFEPAVDSGRVEPEPRVHQDPFGLGGAAGVAVNEMTFPSPAAIHAPVPASSARVWMVECGLVVQGDLSPAGPWRSETDCEADVLRLAWLAGQAAELSPTRLSLEAQGQCWLVLPQPGDRALVACAPDLASAEHAAQQGVAAEVR